MNKKIFFVGMLINGTMPSLYGMHNQALPSIKILMEFIVPNVNLDNKTLNPFIGTDKPSSESSTPRLKQPKYPRRAINKLEPIAIRVDSDSQKNNLKKLIDNQKLKKSNQPNTCNACCRIFPDRVNLFIHNCTHKPCEYSVRRNAYCTVCKKIVSFVFIKNHHSGDNHVINLRDFSDTHGHTPDIYEQYQEITGSKQ